MFRLRLDAQVKRGDDHPQGQTCDRVQHVVEAAVNGGNNDSQDHREEQVSEPPLSFSGHHQNDD